MPDTPYAQRRGRTSRERREQREAEAYAQSPEGARIVQLEKMLDLAAQNVATLFNELKAVKEWQSGLRGEGNVTVNGNVISGADKQPKMLLTDNINDDDEDAEGLLIPGQGQILTVEAKSIVPGENVTFDVTGRQVTINASGEVTGVFGGFNEDSGARVYIDPIIEGAYTTNTTKTHFRGLAAKNDGSYGQLISIEEDPNAEVDPNRFIEFDILWDLQAAASGGIDLFTPLTFLTLKQLDDGSAFAGAISVFDGAGLDAGKVFFQWFYSNTDDSAAYISLVSGITIEGGAVFNVIEKKSMEGIKFRLNEGGDPAGVIIGELLIADVPDYSGQSLLYDPLFNAGTGAAQLRALADGDNITFDIGLHGEIIINADTPGVAAGFNEGAGVEVFIDTGNTTELDKLHFRTLISANSFLTIAETPVVADPLRTITFTNPYELEPLGGELEYLSGYLTYNTIEADGAAGIDAAIDEGAIVFGWKADDVTGSSGTSILGTPLFDATTGDAQFKPLVEGTNITFGIGANQEIIINSTAGAITVQDEGTPLATAASTLNFVGVGVTASGAGATKTITVHGTPKWVTVVAQDDTAGAPSGALTLQRLKVLVLDSTSLATGWALQDETNCEDGEDVTKKYIVGPPDP